MYRIIGADQREYGPVPGERLRQWVRENRANAQTKVRREGEPDWKTLASFAEFSADLGMPAQELPTPPLPVFTEAAFIQAVLGRDDRVQMGRCLARSWRLVLSHGLTLAPATVLVALLLAACHWVRWVGPIVNLLIAGPLEGGLFLLYLRCIRGQSANISDVFIGFSPSFVPLMWAHILTTVLTTLSAMVFFFAVGLATLMRHQIGLPILIGLGGVGLLPAIYLAVAWYFTLPLVIDQRLGFWPAMELSFKKVSRHWWSVFALLAITMLLAAVSAMPYLAGAYLGWRGLELAGLVVFGVALLITVPLMLGAMMYAYEDLFASAESGLRREE